MSDKKYKYLFYIFFCLSSIRSTLLGYGLTTQKTIQRSLGFLSSLAPPSYPKPFNILNPYKKKPLNAWYTSQYVVMTLTPRYEMYVNYYLHNNVIQTGINLPVDTYDKLSVSLNWNVFNKSLLLGNKKSISSPNNPSYLELGLQWRINKNIQIGVMSAWNPEKISIPEKSNSILLNHVGTKNTVSASSSWLENIKNAFIGARLMLTYMISFK